MVVEGMSDTLLHYSCPCRDIEKLETCSWYELEPLLCKSSNEGNLILDKGFTTKTSTVCIGVFI
jgi:hypothetical protein